jgi:hypothetical protein
VHGTNVTGRAIDATVKDLRSRMRGIAAAAHGWWSEGPLDEARLLERVRARLGRVCSHPRAIDVEVYDSTVTLRGAILANEVDAVMKAAASVRGVQSVVNSLEAHESPAGVASLQGGGRMAGPRLDHFQSSWAPAMRALVGMGALAAAGAAAAAYARR